MARRVIIAVTVDSDVDKHEIADLATSYPLSDPTVWEWDDFWADVLDGVVTRTGDTTELDTESSASRQHYIDTGHYLRKGEAL